MDKNGRKDKEHKNSECDKMVKTKISYNWPNIAKNSKNGPQQQLSKIVSLIGNI